MEAIHPRRTPERVRRVPVTAALSAAIIGTTVLITSAFTGCAVARHQQPPGLFANVGPDGRVVLTTGCFEHVGATSELRHDQIIVSDVRTRGPKSGSCGNLIATGLRAGPDVVYPADEQRFALVGDRYREVDYCGIATKRCVPFPTDDVPASCSQDSARSATIGELRGVYPFRVVRCDDRFLMVDLDPCAGYHGTDGPSCNGHFERVLYEEHDGRWTQTPYRQDLMCPADGKGYRPPEMPDWVCDP